MQKNKLYKELREWAMFLSILGFLYFMGAHTMLQRAILYTGLYNPDTEVKPLNSKADYNFQLQDINGQLLDAQSLKGKVVFMNFWATWCPPCVAEMPGIQNLYEDQGSDKVVFIMVSLDDNPAKAEDFLKRKGYTFPVYFLASPLPQVYTHNSIPRTYVLSKEGMIANQKVGMANYDNAQFREFLSSLQ